MRSSFLYFLIATLVLGSVYWYQDTKHLCPVPLSYRIGEIDSSFNLSPLEARAHVEAAERVWEEESGWELFTYDESADFTVNFVFDERQALADSETSEKAALDEKKATNEEIFFNIERLQQEYQTLKNAYEVRLAAYESRLRTYNQEVARYNDQGGAPESVFAELEAERRALATESDALEAETRTLNDLIAEVNKLGEQGQVLVDQYNREVESYNQQFGFSREFTQGDYQGDRINIYKFSNDAELERVLAHEFGHALGIDHVEGEGSLMYYLMEEIVQPPSLAAEDMVAFTEVCGTGEETGATIRRAIRSFLTLIN